jgi:hypothetical protein
MQYSSAQEQEARDSHSQYLQSRNAYTRFLTRKGRKKLFAVRLLRFAIFKNSCTKIPLSFETNI